MAQQKVSCSTRSCLPALIFTGKHLPILAVKSHSTSQRTRALRDNIASIVHFQVIHNIRHISRQLKALRTFCAALPTLAAIQVKSAVSARKSNGAIITGGAAHPNRTTMKCLTMFDLHQGGIHPTWHLQESTGTAQ
eukprot:Skav202411  [mRNA]  locus=scaffold815:530763:531799:- [translate_table: standard]